MGHNFWPRFSKHKLCKILSLFCSNSFSAMHISAVTFARMTKTFWIFCLSIILADSSFYLKVISSTCHFVNLLFRQLVISSTCHFVNLSFRQLVVPFYKLLMWFLNMSSGHFINCHFTSHLKLFKLLPFGQSSID